MGSKTLVDKILESRKLTESSSTPEIGTGAVVINVENSAYAMNQISNAYTVGELRDVLSRFDEDDWVFLLFDRGYTYGTLCDSDFRRYHFDVIKGDDGDEDEEDWVKG